MRDKELRYIERETLARIEDILNSFLGNPSGIAPDELLSRITELLPIEKMNFDTVKRRIEGYYYATEKMWEHALKSGKTTRQEIVKLARLKPLSHYHYLTGSREPANLLQTRDDMLNDPSTAMVKLRDDILGLAKVLPQLTS